MVNNMKLNDYTKKRNLIFTADVLLIAVGTSAIYIATKSIAAVIIIAAFMLCVCILSFAQYRLDDKYISGVTDDLSRLCDNLTTLEEKIIFPENEDTMLSKLQNKILKLVRILKKKNETSEQEHENIKALVSDISHQLKTPIANLKMYSDFLEDDDINETQRKKYVDIIRLSVDRLNFLSESMIKISRLESGLIHLQPDVQDLQATVMISIKDVFTKAKAKGINIAYIGENINVFHDRRWTAEAVFNLLDNAVKYSKGNSEISVSVKQFGMFAAVEVADENAPIPEEEQSKIFSRFYRGPNGRGIEGIGIGLYLSRKIAVEQGGYMKLKVSDKGNTFSIVLPCHCPS